MWATLPCELLLQIFCRLGSTAVIRSAGVCRPWRRAIIDNASCLQPRPDRFLPDLLLAVLDTYWSNGHLRYETAAPPPANVPALDGVDTSLFHKLLASRDGFLLLVENAVSSSRLCLCNPLTGSRRILPAAMFGRPSDYCAYILVTGYDDYLPDAVGAGGSMAVRILAVVGEENRITYRIFSSTSGGTWGPVKHIAKIILQDVGTWKITLGNNDVVVCGGSVVYWLVMSFPAGSRICLFAMDLRTERTWTIELPDDKEGDMGSSIVATSENGQWPSLIVPRLKLCKVAVWVLDSDHRWTLQWMMDMQSLLLANCRITLTWVGVCCFCPRSGCLFCYCIDDQQRLHDFVIHVDGTSPRLIETANTTSSSLLPYEMDWSTYISKMKYF